MGVHTMTPLKRLYQQACEWWDEYYTDNPIAWLLMRQVRYAGRQQFSSSLQELEKALKRAQQARDQQAIQNLLITRGELLRGIMAPQPFWKRSDRWWALILWSLCLLAAAAIYLQGLQTLIQSQLRVPGFWFFFAAMAGILPFSYSTMLRALLVTERERGTGMFLWLTRLTGRHLVYGSLCVLVLHLQVRTYIVFLSPLVWLVGTIMWDNPLRGLWVAALVGWQASAFALFWMVLSVFIIPTTPNSLMNIIFYFINVLFAFGIIMLSLPAFYLTGFTSRPFMSMFAMVDMTPVWSWFRLPIWWISFSPPLGQVSLLFVRHPLWGLLQGFIYVGLMLWLLPLAVRFADRVRRCPQPEPHPDEGDW